MSHFRMPRTLFSPQAPCHSFPSLCSRGCAKACCFLSPTPRSSSWHHHFPVIPFSKMTAGPSSPAADAFVCLPLHVISLTDPTLFSVPRPTHARDPEAGSSWDPVTLHRAVPFLCLLVRYSVNAHFSTQKWHPPPAVRGGSRCGPNSVLQSPGRCDTAGSLLDLRPVWKGFLQRRVTVTSVCQEEACGGKTEAGSDVLRPEAERREKATEASDKKWQRGRPKKLGLRS